MPDSVSGLPKVSGILPVGCGDRYFRVAMSAFLAQTYEGELELVVVDNSDKPIEDLLPDDDRIKYFRSDRLPVGALRNAGTS
jgi:glycosyltransferase involved in cell wall biosynthesis